MKHSSQFAPLLLVFVLAGMVCVACAESSHSAVVKGVVRDTHGSPQMGAVVQVLGPDATAIATAITDLNGRYRIHDLAPGRYEMRATAVLFLPAMRQNLRLGAGVQTTVNLTLNALYDATQWLPVRRRVPDAPSDDWAWTLRSAQNRPVLRIFDDAFAGESAQRHTMEHSAAVLSGGGFGNGGVHSVVSMDRGGDEGSAAIFRADLGVPRVGNSLDSSFDLSTGYERSLGFAGMIRMAAFYQNHPELKTGSAAGQRSGLETMTLINAQRMEFGDTVAVEVGSMLRGLVSPSSETSLTAQPFLNVTVRPASGLLLAYRMATARELQSVSDLDSLHEQTPTAVLSGGALKTERGRHQEISVTKKTGRGKVQAALYADDLAAPTLSGVGAPAPGMDGVLSDPSTGSFRMLGPSYRARGISVAVAEPITQALWISGEYSTGDALVSTGPTTGSLDAAAGQLTSQWSQTGMVALEGNFVNTGTNLRMSYRWQLRSTVTAVNAYDAASDRAYLDFYVRQPLRWRLLPDGFEAVLDVDNLLAQGYRPVAVSPDGKMLYFAQAARTVQGGLAFTF